MLEVFVDSSSQSYRNKSAMDSSISQTEERNSPAKAMQMATPTKEAFLREGIQSFELSNQIYSLKILYSEKMAMIEMQAEQKKSFEFFSATIFQKNLPKDLLYFQDVHSIYQFLSANPSQTLSYNMEGKFISIKDYVGKKAKYFNIPLKQRTLTPMQIVQLKLHKSEKKAKMLEEENQKIKKELDQALRKIKVTEEELKEERELRKIDGIKKEKAEERMEWLFKQNRILRGKLRMEQRQEALDDEAIQIMLKKKKYSSEKEKTDDEISSPKLPLPIHKESAFKTVDFGSKLSFQIPSNQRNYLKFAINEGQIRKNISSRSGCMIYLKPLESLRKKSERCFIGFLKAQNDVRSNNYSVLGLIEEHEVDEINCSNSKKAVYLNASSGVLNIGGDEVKMQPVNWRQGALTMVVEPQQSGVNWYLGQKVIMKCKIPVELGKLNLYPFIELMDHTCVLKFT